MTTRRIYSHTDESLKVLRFNSLLKLKEYKFLKRAVVWKLKYPQLRSDYDNDTCTRHVRAPKTSDRGEKAFVSRCGHPAATDLPPLSRTTVQQLLLQ